MLGALALSGAGLGRQGPGVPGVAGHGRGVGPLVAPRSGNPHLDSQLAQVVLSARAHGAAAGLEAAKARKIGVDHGQVRVIVEAKTHRDAGSVTAVTAAGGTVLARVDGAVEALVPPGALEELAANSAVAEVRAPATPYPQAVDEGVAASNASAWHTAGYDGAGVKVAVIDTGFYGYQSLLGTALPSSVTAIDHCSGQITASPDDGGTKHGTAVAEIVHQMAPGAQLWLICVDNEIALAQAEHDAVVAGVQIINHSVAWYATSRGDGTGEDVSPDAIVADARAHGILWVNSAGNDAHDHWNGTFTADPSDPDVNDFHAGDTSQTVKIHPGEQACVYLKWDAWPTTTEDYDLGLVRESGDTQTLVAFSNNDQADYQQQPTEYLCYTNPDTVDAFYGIVITRYSAAGSPRLDLFFTGSAELEYYTAGSLVEPASSPNAVGVGAVCWQAGGPPEPYSAVGPTIDGRTKPDLLAFDGV